MTIKGIEVPQVAFGTWQLSGEDCFNETIYALKAGYRHIDTALAYQNEDVIGKAIKKFGIKREELFITTKVPADIKTYEGAKEAINTSLKNLDTPYLDMCLIHAPWPWSDVGGDYSDGNVEVWKALIEAQHDGKIRLIGVSNFHPKDIEYIVNKTNVWPVVNQIRYFVGNTQDAIVDYCKAHDIIIAAYSPLATGELVDNAIIKEVAKKYNTTPANICLSYVYTKGYILLSKSKTESRIIDNITKLIKLADEDMRYLDSLKHIASTRPLRS